MASTKGVKSKSYMGSVSGHGMHSPHDGGQSAKSFGKGAASPNTSTANEARTKANGGHKSGGGHGY